MKCVFQIMSAESGVRSEPFACDRAKLSQVLRDGGYESEHDDFVLVLAEVSDQSEMVTSRVPLMRLSTWRNYFPELEAHG